MRIGYWYPMIESYGMGTAGWGFTSPDNDLLLSFQVTSILIYYREVLNENE